MCQQQIHTSNAIYMPYMPITSCADMDNYVSLSISYELNAMNNVTMTTGMHTFIITGICPGQICLPH